MTVPRLADLAYLAALVCLPWIGVDLIVAVSGRDLGAGLQPAYFLLGIAVGLRLATLARPGGRDVARAALHGATGRRVKQALVVGGAVLAVSAVGLLVAPSGIPAAAAWGRYVRQVIQVGIMTCFVVYPAFWTRGAGRWGATATAVTVGLVLQLLYGAVQAAHFLGSQPLFAAIDHFFTSNPAILSGSEELYLAGHFRGVPRLRGTACEPLYLGNYLLLALPLAASLTARKPWARLVVALGGVLLLLTWSRGAVLAAALGIVVWMGLRRRACLPSPVGRVAAGTGMALAATALVTAAIAGSQGWLYPLQRLVQSFDTGDWSNLTRLYSMQAAWRAFLQSPVVGVGWGQFAYHFPQLVDPLGLQSQFTWPVVNNVVLLILSETGAIGLAGLGWLAWRLGRATWRGLADADPAARARLAAVAAATVAIFLQLQTFSQYNLPHIWVAPGLWLAALGESEVR